MVQYDQIFTEVRQRVAAFRYFNEWLGGTEGYGHIKEEQYLDDAYRFLFSTADRGFIEFCALKEGMTFDEYCDMLGVCEEDLIGSGLED